MVFLQHSAHASAKKKVRRGKWKMESNEKEGLSLREDEREMEKKKERIVSEGGG